VTHRDPLSWIEDELEQLDDRGLRRQLAERGGPQAARIVLDGRPLINFGSNDYLGLAADKRVCRAAANAWQQGQGGSGASPLVTGRSELHARLERRLAEFERAEAALLFPTGFAANLGTVAALVGRGDVVFSDERNHASIIDGCRLSRAVVVVYPHRDASGLRQLLEQSRGYRRRLIVTDSLFSMDGDLAPLAELAELAERHAAMLMVDEAHATGVLGEHGRGVAELLGAEDGVHVRVGTLSKALGTAGGFVAGRRPLIQWLLNRARGYVFSTAAPAALAAATLASLDVVRDEPQRRATLLARAAELRERLRAQAWDVGDSQSQIIPVIVGGADRVMVLARRLQQSGLLVPGIRPPTVPPNHALLRISLCWTHADQMVASLLDELASLRAADE
jgi:8-amino-7-oxononanoate synthase